MNINAAFQWECQPKAENLILDIVQRAMQANVAIARLEKNLLQLTINLPLFAGSLQPTSPSL